MKLPVHGHLTYCSNIHPGETWPEVWGSLKDHLPRVKEQVSPDQPLGIGLRLSNQASVALQNLGMSELMDWMQTNGFYVFTMNGFPFGGFHHQRVKDEVHQPDWTTPERVKYTQRLFDLLAQMLPEGIDGGISTSPLSYKPWLSNEQQPHVFRTATENLLKIVVQLHHFYQKKGILMHLDIEPEPDGLIENSFETISYFEDWLIPIGRKQLSDQLGISADEAEKSVRRHITVCYDVCHFAVAYESPAEVMRSLAKAGIGIGKIQISSALKSDFNPKLPRKAYAEVFQSLDEPTYLHQVVALAKNQSRFQYQDLSQALVHIERPDIIEWRTHFHVPVFVESYGLLDSTQKDIREVLKLWLDSPMTNHLEVETYTWEILPKQLQTEINASIAREINWVKNQLTMP